MVIVAQLVRASDCGSEGRGFESHLSPIKAAFLGGFFYIPQNKICETEFKIFNYLANIL